ncbi:ABC transporter permease [Nocardiopsis suaedae]|uniref:ABC transporter permease n=1 Tax=Nocardiopsis suaedae TaxID=3018444 RepID=A0ABT4TK96_9ACTN|nr:ABC transporter permease [Nocardiopsis suaedae]MDA2804679.1 ABC transporter permease [Nocardiopsis suaedae]
MTATARQATVAAGTAAGRDRGPGRVTLMLALTRAELRLLMRRKGVLAVALFLPMMLVGISYLGARPEGPAQWGATLGVYFMYALMMTPYMSTTTQLSARRDTLVYKRLRTTELDGAELIAGSMLAIALLSAVQMALMLGVFTATGAPLPQHPLLVVVGAVLGLVLALVLAAFIVAVTGSHERVMFTMMPLLILAVIGAQLIDYPVQAVAWGAMLVPMVPAADLIAKGFGGTGVGAADLPVPVDPVVADLLLLVAWTAVALLVTRRTWRWEPRS